MPGGETGEGSRRRDEVWGGLEGGQRSLLNGLGEEQYSRFGTVPLAGRVLVENCSLCLCLLSSIFGTF